MRTSVSALVYAAALSVALSSAPAAETAKPVLTVKGLNKRETVVLITGMAHGIATVNFFGKMRGIGQFCQPKSVRIDGQRIFDMASRSLNGPQKPDVIAIAAVDELRREFPCR